MPYGEPPDDVVLPYGGGAADDSAMKTAARVELVPLSAQTHAVPPESMRIVLDNAPQRGRTATAQSVEPSVKHEGHPLSCNDSRSGKQRRGRDGARHLESGEARCAMTAEEFKLGEGNVRKTLMEQNARFREALVAIAVAEVTDREPR